MNMKKENRKSKFGILLELLLVSLKTGLFSFGGGYAMIALLRNEFVEKRNWIEKDEFTDMIAIAESTPGPIAINCSTYAGYKRCGVSGSIVATLGVTLPSFIVIYIVSLFFDAFLSFKYVALAFKGIRVCVTFLILSAGLKMLIASPKTAFNLIVFTLTAAAVVTLSLLGINFSSVFLILFSALVGLLCYLIKSFKTDKDGQKS